MSSDKEIIDSLGGSTKVAARLGRSVQCVQNWKKRGIPARIRLNHPDVFPMPAPSDQAPAKQPQ